VKIHPLAIGAVAAVGGAAIMLASGANAGTTSSSEQLIINQRISQAAVRRSNTALNYMGVIRTSTLDNTYGLNKSNPKGVTPLTQVTGAGLGWQTPQIRDGQVTSSKVADGAVTTSKIAAGGVTQEKLANKTYWAKYARITQNITASSGGVTAVRNELGQTTLTFPVAVNACAYSTTISDTASANGYTISAISTGERTIQVNTVANGTTSLDPSAADAGYSIIVYC